MHLVFGNWNGNRMRIKIKILQRVKFGFLTNENFIFIPILKNDPNTLMNGNEIDFPFSFSIPTYQT